MSWAIPGDALRLDSFEVADRVHKMLAGVEPVEDDSIVPTDSVIREFIGRLEFVVRCDDGHSTIEVSKNQRPGPGALVIQRGNHGVSGDSFFPAEITTTSN